MIVYNQMLSILLQGIFKKLKFLEVPYSLSGYYQTDKDTLFLLNKNDVPPP